MVDTDQLFRFAIHHFGNDHTKKFKIHSENTDEDLRAMYETSTQTGVPISK